MGKKWTEKYVADLIFSTGLGDAPEAIAQAHEQELDELKAEMGKAQDLLGAAYGLLRNARGEAKKE